MKALHGPITDRRLVERHHTASDGWEPPRPSSPDSDSHPVLPSWVSGTSLGGH